MSDSLTDFVNNHKPDEIWVCNECGSPNVNVRAWVNANTQEYAGNTEETGIFRPDESGFYCSECNVHIDLYLITQEEFNKRQENK